jgi:phospholipid/cholesterol/gamma-HCH transport system substrate-binding protein
MTMMLSRDKSIFDGVIDLHAMMENADGLKMGAGVQLRGIKIGSVKNIEFESLDKIKITLAVVDKYQNLIKQDSLVSIKTQGVLGDKFIEIQGGTESSPVAPAHFSLQVNNDSGMKAILDKGQNIMITANNVLSKVEAMLDDINGESQLRTTVSSLAKTSKGMSTIFDEQGVKDIKNLTSGLSDLSNRLKEGPGAIHSLIYDKSVYEDIRTLLGGAQRNKVLKYFIRESINKTEEIQSTGP